MAMLYGEKLGEALTIAIQKKNISDRQVAIAFGVKPPSVAEWKTTGRIHKKHTQKLVEFFGDVVSAEHWGLDHPVIAAKGCITLELLDIQAAAGSAIVPADHPEVLQRVSVSEEWAQQEFGGKLARIRLITARGDSMSGTVEDGDVLFVDASVQHYTSEGVYVLWDGEGVQVKRLQRLVAGGLRIISDNPTYPTQEAPSLTILGRVLGAWNLRKFN